MYVYYLNTINKQHQHNEQINIVQLNITIDPHSSRV